MYKSVGTDPKSMAGRPKVKADLLGQTFTPSPIAEKMADILVSHRPSKHVSLLDPAVGPGTFPLALHEKGYLRKDDSLVLYDIDPVMISRARQQLSMLICKVNFRLSDYLLDTSGRRYDFAILNPPYIRQEWIDKKDEYRHFFNSRYRAEIPGTSNLYVYFIAKVLADLKPNGKVVSIVYDAWQFTKYGRWLYSILRENCDSLETIPLSNKPFDNRLINATIIVAKRTRKPLRLSADSSSAIAPIDRRGPFDGANRFCPLADLYRSKRGLRLKQADFFLCDLKDVSQYGATPFVKKPGKIAGYLVPENHPEAALLASSGNQNERTLAELTLRLKSAQRNPEANVSVLTWYRGRPEAWYLHSKPPMAPILFSYYLRGRPKHICNPARAYADNFYGLWPKYSCSTEALVALMNSTVVCAQILARSRNQGSGLAKIQLYEYRSVWIPDWTSFSSVTITRLGELGKTLLQYPNAADDTIADVDEVIASEIFDQQLDPPVIRGLYSHYDRIAKQGGRGI